MAKLLWYEVVVAAITDEGVIYAYPSVVQHGESPDPLLQLDCAKDVVDARIGEARGGITYAAWRSRVAWHKEDPTKADLIQKPEEVPSDPYPGARWVLLGVGHLVRQHEPHARCAGWTSITDEIDARTRLSDTTSAPIARVGRLPSRTGEADGPLWGCGHDAVSAGVVREVHVHATAARD